MLAPLACLHLGGCVLGWDCLRTASSQLGFPGHRGVMPPPNQKPPGTRSMYSSQAFQGCACHSQMLSGHPFQTVSKAAAWAQQLQPASTARALAPSPDIQTRHADMPGACTLHKLCNGVIAKPRPQHVRPPRASQGLASRAASPPPGTLQGI